MEREFISIKVAVMLVSDAPSTLDESTGKLVVDKLVDAGHDVWPIEVIKDSEDAVRKQIDSWIDFSDVDVIIAISGFETDATQSALAPLITKQLTGFSDLFRLLTYREIGTAAMLTEVIAAQCGHTFVFALPAARGAVATALEKLLIPQLDCRTRPRNLVMRMPRHKAKVPTTGPMSFPKEDTPFGVPPPPRNAGNTTRPPPPPRKRSPSVHSTPPMPVVAVAPPKIADAEVAELDPNAVIEESIGQPTTGSLEEAIEKSIEASGASIGDAEVARPPVVETQREILDDNDPAVVAAREHASKTPEAQAAAWVAAVEQAASKVVKRAVAEREAREELKRNSAEIKIPKIDDEIEAAELFEETPSRVPEPKPEPIVVVAAVAAVETGEEPRGKIEKATTGKPAPKPDRAIDKEAAVIVADPDLVEKQRTKAASLKPPNVVKLPPPRVVEPEAVFSAREWAGTGTTKTNRTWMLAGGLAVIGAIVLLIVVMGKRNTNASTNEPPSASLNNPPIDPPPPPPTNNGGGLLGSDPPPPIITPDANGDIEMDPVARPPDNKTVPPTNPVANPNDPKPPKPPKPPKNPDDPDVTKAPANPSTSEDCDEVSCILNKFNKPCCERFKPAGQPPVEKPPVEKPVNPTNPTGGPVELDKTLIRIGVERFRAQIIRCGESSGAKGTVSLAVVVSPEGAVNAVSVSESPDPALGQCAASIMKKATFAKTQNGGSFTYPFVF